MQGFGLPPHPGQGGYPGPAFPGAAPGFPGMGALPDPGASLGQPGLPQGADPAQLQQLVQLLGAKMLPKQTAVVECPKSMVGRVIGKGGETIKSLQQYTGAMIQVSGAARQPLSNQRGVLLDAGQTAAPPPRNCAAAQSWPTAAHGHSKCPPATGIASPHNSLPRPFRPRRLTSPPTPPASPSPAARSRCSWRSAW
jgi:hypothetical protein